MTDETFQELTKKSITKDPTECSMDLILKIHTYIYILHMYITYIYIHIIYILKNNKRRHGREERGRVIHC